MRSSVWAFPLLMAALPAVAQTRTTAGSSPAGNAGPDSAEIATADGDVVVTALSLRDTVSGVLGARELVDLPFSVTTFSDELQRNLGGRTLKDVVSRDASVTTTGSVNRGDFFQVRGFDVDPLTYASLPGLSFQDLVDVSNLERVEVFRGVNAISIASSPFGGIGGSINLVPKTPGDRPVTQASLGFDTKSTFIGQTDLSRRIAGGRVGLRFNGRVQSGGSDIDLYRRGLYNASINGDVRVSDRLLLTAEVAYQRMRVRNQSGASLSGADLLGALPEKPELSTNLDLGYGAFNTESWRAIAGLSWTISDRWSLNISGGLLFPESRITENSATLTSLSGDLAISNFLLRNDESRRDSVQANLRGEVATGPLTHQLILSASSFRVKRSSGDFYFPASPYTSNLYAPVRGDAPTIASTDIPLTFDFSRRATTYTAFDNIIFLDGAAEVLVGVRHVDITSSGIGVDGKFRKTVPVFAGTIHPFEGASLYANYAKGLTLGAQAPADADVTNALAFLPPGGARQVEIGAKYQVGKVLVTGAAFSIKRPFGVLVANGTSPPTRTFVYAGTERHRGVELRAEGQPFRGLRLVSGLTYLDAKGIGTGDPATEGKRVPGVAKWVADVYAEADLPFVAGLSVNGNLTYNGRAFVDPVNAVSTPSWAQFDAGAIYRFDIGGHAVTARAFVTNVTASRYWIASIFSSLNYSAPRSLRSSLTVDF